MAPKKLATLPSAKEMQDLSVKELKDLCQKRDMDQGGKKDDLIKRLVSFGKASEKGKENTAAAKNDKKESAAKAQKTKADVAPVEKPAKKGAVAKPDVKSADVAPAKAAAAKADKKSTKTAAAEKPEEAEPSQPPADETAPSPRGPAPKASPAKIPAKSPVKSPAKSPAKPVGPFIPAGHFRIVDHIMPGSTVVLHNLSQADLNGKQAQVLDWDADKGRWKCKLLEKNFVANFRSWNLMLPIAVGATVELRGLKSTPELNGKLASIEDWVKNKGRWRCTIVETGESGDFLPNNMQLARFPKPESNDGGERVDLLGQCAILTGLRAAPELNGQEVEVIAWVEDKERWDCNLKDGKSVTFKPANLLLWNYASEPVPYEEVAQVFNTAWDSLKRLQESIAASGLAGDDAEEPDSKRARAA